MNDSERVELEAIRSELMAMRKRIDVLLEQPLVLKFHPPTPIETASPAFRVFSDALVETFARVTGRSYVFDGAKDAQAIKRLIKTKIAMPLLVGRWETCLRTPAPAGTHSIAVFAARVNGFSDAVPGEMRKVANDFDPYR